MKVKSITPLKDKEDKDLWRVNFEEDKRSMWLGFAPKFTAGDTIDDDKIQESSTGKSWIFKKKGEAKTEVKSEPKRSYGKTPEEQASIEHQVDKKVTSEIYCCHIEKGVPFNKKLLDEIFRAVQSLGRSVAEVAKEEYGAVEK